MVQGCPTVQGASGECCAEQNNEPGGGEASKGVSAGDKMVRPHTGTCAIVLQLQMGIVENLRESDPITTL
jgi:hypothetical protein